MIMTLWGGAFNQPTDDDLRALNDSIGFDKRLYAVDIEGSIAYAQALADAGVISGNDSETIIDGLEQVRREFETDQFTFQPGDEDIHTAVERRLTELIGAAGGKLHTGRSRNDQVATDFRLWTIDALHRIDERLAALQSALIAVAEPHIETVMPGYTHLQPAQPITAAHWLMSFFWMFVRDRQRLAGAQERANVSPLGSGALAGTPFALDRERLAAMMGFEAVSENSLDAVSDRDFAAEALFACALIGVHLSRMAEDLILFSNPAFGFVTLDDRYSTGSSLMPQKRNPDPMELARGKAGRLIGSLTGFLTTLKGLPSGYNKDLQEDKEPLFDSVETLERLLPVITAVMATLKLNPEQMRAALDQTMLATDLADFLVMRGLPFREAHHVSGRAVRLAQEKGVAFSALTLDDLRALSPLFTEETAAVFDMVASTARRRAQGGTAPQAVRAQIERARAWLEQD
ncbi:MAG: argininosuccinate lyase [bacterium]|nr:argininosuccinate lyase [bacterium]